MCAKKTTRPGLVGIILEIGDDSPAKRTWQDSAFCPIHGIRLPEAVTAGRFTYYPILILLIFGEYKRPPGIFPRGQRTKARTKRPRGQGSSVAETDKAAAHEPVAPKTAEAQAALAAEPTQARNEAAATRKPPDGTQRNDWELLLQFRLADS